MLTSIWEDVKREFSYGNMVTRLVIINCAFFVFINLVKIIMTIAYGGPENAGDTFDNFLHFFCMSSDAWYLITHPWVFFTSIFLHEGFFHILWNMLFLYWFGRIVGDLIGNHRIFPIYLLSGLFGNVIFFLTANFLYASTASNGFALGASGAVMGIVAASAMVAPNYLMRLILIGEVKLKYIVAVLIFLDMIGIANDVNTGGHFAHLGGVIMGWIFVTQLQKGNDMSEPVNNMLDRLQNFFKGLTGNSKAKSRRPKVVYKATEQSQKSRQRGTDPKDASHQEKLDAILDKIKKSGYDSLNDEEKEFLFKASKK